MSEGNRSRSRLLPSLLGLLILLSGLALLAGGIKLASLGGSLYYLLAGIGLALSGLLLLLGKRAALGLYALVLFASTVWALWEVGLDSSRRSRACACAISACRATACSCCSTMVTSAVSTPGPICATNSEAGIVPLPATT